MSTFSPRHCAQHYYKTGLQARVSEASPHQLIALLLDGACQRIGVARACLGDHVTGADQPPPAPADLARKGKAIAAACAIIAHLHDSLDHAKGGEIAANLAALYDWLLQHLTQANLNNDVAALDAALGVLHTLQTAWTEIGRTAIPQAA